MDAVRSVTMDRRWVGRRLVAAIILALLITAAAAMTRMATETKLSGANRAGSSWSRMMVVFEPEGASWS